MTAAEDVRLFDRGTATWRQVPTDLKAGDLHEVFGKTVPVMSRDALITYKRILSRDLDLEDVIAISG